LAAFIRRHAHGNILPERGWHLAGSNGSEAEFLAGPTLAGLPDGDIGQAYYPEAQLAFDGDRWRVRGYGGCQPQVAVDDLNAATFRLAEGQHVDRETASFDVLVTEWACASGHSSQDRLHAPMIDYQESRVVIAFTVTRQGGDQTCPTNPQATYRITLSEPLGNRAIVDAGKLPWAIARPADPALTASPTGNDLEPPDASEPAAGICEGPSKGPVATIQLNVDTASPRCLQVLPTQRLQIANRFGESVSVTVAGATFELADNDTRLVSAELGQIWEPGVHLVKTSAYAGGNLEVVLLSAP
jgi:hypothetical protein